MPSLNKVQVVLAELDKITGQQSASDWAEAELQSYQGGQYLEVRDTTPGENAGKVAYLVYVDTDPTTGERQYGPVLLLKSNRFQPGSAVRITTEYEPLDNDMALTIIQAIKLSKLAQIMRYNNIMVINALALPADKYASSHYAQGDNSYYSLSSPLNPINRIILNSNNSEHNLHSAFVFVLVETFETLGHLEFLAGRTPPNDGAFIILDPQTDPSTISKDLGEVLRNSILNAKRYMKSLGPSVEHLSIW